MDKIDPNMCVSCDEMIELVIASKYSFGAQIGILRQKDVKPEEFQEFYDFVEQVKKDVRAEYGVQTSPTAEETTTTTETTTEEDAQAGDEAEAHAGEDAAD